jgi:hypothetical protein
MRGDRLVIDTIESTGKMPRPNRTLNVRVLLDTGEEVTASGRDGERLIINING